VENSCPWKGSTMKFSDAIGKLHCGAGFNTGQKQKTLSVPGRLWSMYIRAVEWNLTTGLLTVYIRVQPSRSNIVRYTKEDILWRVALFVVYEYETH
jgi:hypothetical protein